MIGLAPAGKGSPMRRRRRLGLLGPLAPARFLPPRAAAVAGCLLLLAACGGPRPGLAVSLASDALQVLRGGQVTVEVTLTRLGDASGDVTLEVSGLPTKVQGTFSPTVLSGDELTSTLTLSADASAPEDVSIVTVTAAGAGLASEAQLALEVESLTVAGHMVGLLGAPLSGATVVSQDDQAALGSDGSFKLVGLSVPYDVTAFSTADDKVHVYRGLTASEIELSSTALLPVTTPRSAKVTGSVTGGSVPIGANQVVVVCAEGMDRIVDGCTSVDPTTSGFDLTVNWYDQFDRSVRLHLLERETDTGGQVVGYPGYATVDLELTNGETVNLPEPIDLGEALYTETVELSVDSPVPVTSTVAAVQVGPNLAIAVQEDNTAATDLTVTMPVLPNATYLFGSGVNIERAAWVMTSTGGSVTVAVPELPTLTAPADSASDVTTATEFTVSNPTGGALTWVWSGGGGYVSSLTTMATSVTIPDTSEYGVPLPAADTVQWQVVASGGETAEAGSHWINDLLSWVTLWGSGGSPGFGGDGSIAISDVRDFTTAP